MWDCELGHSLVFTNGNETYFVKDDTKTIDKVVSDYNSTTHRIGVYSKNMARRLWRRKTKEGNIIKKCFSFVETHILDEKSNNPYFSNITIRLKVDDIEVEHQERKVNKNSCRAVAFEKLFNNLLNG